MVVQLLPPSLVTRTRVIPLAYTCPLGLTESWMSFAAPTMLSGLVGLTAIEVSLCRAGLVSMTSVLTLAALETGVVPMGLEGFLYCAMPAPSTGEAASSSPPSPALGAKGLMLGTSRASSCSSNSRVVRRAPLRIGRVTGRVSASQIQGYSAMGASRNGMEQGRKPSAPRADRVRGSRASRRCRGADRHQLAGW